jgi:hypothetical protein
MKYRNNFNHEIINQEDTKMQFASVSSWFIISEKV